MYRTNQWMWLYIINRFNRVHPMHAHTCCLNRHYHYCIIIVWVYVHYICGVVKYTWMITLTYRTVKILLPTYYSSYWYKFSSVCGKSFCKLSSKWSRNYKQYITVYMCHWFFLEHCSFTWLYSAAFEVLILGL